MDTREAAGWTLIRRYALALTPEGAGIEAAVTAASAPPLSGGPDNHGSKTAHRFTIADSVGGSRIRQDLPAGNESDRLSMGVLPEDGEDLAFTIIGLPGPGRRHGSRGGPVTWITDWTMTGAGVTWARLSEKAAETGLRPFLLADMPGEPGRPWGTPGSTSDEIVDTPLDTTAIDRLDAATVLAGYWWADDQTFAEDEEFRSILEPFGPGFSRLYPVCKFHRVCPGGRPTAAVTPGLPGRPQPGSSGRCGACAAG
jgi:hypothetical protein